jgi:hypothetical protein
MAKDPKRPAGGFEGENTGGLLSGFLAEEHQFDRRALWRVGTWGIAAVSAVVLGVMSNQSTIALRRDEVAAADLVRQAQQLQSIARESQSETRRLASAVDTLNGDRDRLFTRMTVIEQGLDSVTGALGRQTPNAAPVQVTPLPASPPLAAPDPQAWLQNLAPATVPAPAASPVPTAALKPAEKPNAETREAAKATDKPMSDGAAPPPAAIAVATTAVKSTDKSIAEPKAMARPAARPVTEAKADKPITEAKAAEKSNPETAHEKGPVTVSAIGPPAPSAPAAPPAPPLVAPKSIMAPPDPAAVKLLEPAKSAAASSATASIAVAKPEAEPAAPADQAEAEELDAASAGVAALQRTEFGVDVGTANSIAGLRALWRGLLKSRSNAALTTLRPIIVVREGSNGLGMQLRLVAGPLSDAAAAAKICAGMSENSRPCEATVFEGQRLAIKAEDPDAKSPAVKPAPRKRTVPKHIAAPEEPNKPEPPSTMSTLFGKR